jgi:acyl carrier protein
LLILKNIRLIQKILNEENKKKLVNSKNLDDFIWDSMSMIMVITILKDEYKKKNIDVKKLRSLKSVFELDKFLTSYIK